jgi:hypothetical protein
MYCVISDNPMTEATSTAGNRLFKSTKNDYENKLNMFTFLITFPSHKIYFQPNNCWYRNSFVKHFIFSVFICLLNARFVLNLCDKKL